MNMKKSISMILSLLMAFLWAAPAYADTTGATPLPAISLDIIQEAGGNRLTWDPVSGAETYRIYRGTPDNVIYELLDAVDGVSYTDSGVTGDTTYHYLVQAVFPNGQSVTAYGSAAAATPEPTLTPEPDPMTAATRDQIIFGSYEQDNNTGNGQEPIEWLVLEVRGDRALLISRYGLDVQPYNREPVKVTWETCSLREWLNGTFLNTAFSAGEQAAIALTPADNGADQGYSGWSTGGGNNTLDRIFLLSCAEAEKYLGVTWDDEDNPIPRMSPSAYALHAAENTGGDNTADEAAAWMWWLRSPGVDQDCAAVVYIDGSLFYCQVDQDSVCVRPVLWADLGSDIFAGVLKATPTPLVLEAPGGLEVRAADQTSVTLTWKSVPYAEGYRVMVKERGSSDWREAAYTENTAAQVTRLLAGTEYQIRVIAESGSARSGSGIITVKTAEATPTPLVLEAPGGLEVRAADQTSVTLTWESVPYAEGYRVMVKERDSSDWREAEYTENTAAQVTPLLAGTEYQIRVIAESGSARSGSGIITVKTAEPTSTPPALEAPDGLEVRAADQTSVTLTWESVPYAEGYRVMVKERDSSDWREAEYTKNTAAQVARLLAGTEYQIRVVAESGSARSGSGIITVKTAEATPKPAPTKKPLRVGGTVKFGHYPQTAGGKDDAEIQWLVLEVDTANRRALVISRYALDCRPYNSSVKNVTWETCSLRKWLNGAFLDNAFTARERNGIVTAKVDNSAGQGYSGWSTDGGNNTEDRIFLLSYAEAWKYFGTDIARQCRPTEHAAAQGAYRAGNGNCWWWLRSPGSSLSSVRVVNDRGVRDLGNVDDTGVAVRPALWVDLDSGIF